MVPPEPIKFIQKIKLKSPCLLELLLIDYTSKMTPNDTENLKYIVALSLGGLFFFLFAMYRSFGTFLSNICNTFTHENYFLNISYKLS